MINPWTEMAKIARLERNKTKSKYLSMSLSKMIFKKLQYFILICYKFLIV